MMDNMEDLIKLMLLLLTDFREGNELASCLSGFVDEVDGLADTALEVEPARLGSDLYKSVNLDV
jgi:hypothetical protein